MENVNLINGADIQGNIGSCTTQVEDVYLDRGVFTVDVMQIATNSCTSEVQTYDTWKVSGLGAGLIFFVITAILLILLILVGLINE